MPLRFGSEGSHNRARKRNIGSNVKAEFVGGPKNGERMPITEILVVLSFEEDYDGNIQTDEYEFTGSSVLFPHVKYYRYRGNRSQ